MTINYGKKEKRLTIFTIFLVTQLFVTTTFALKQDQKSMNTPLIEKMSAIIPSDKSFYYTFDDKAHHDISWKLITTSNTEGMILGTPESVDIRDTSNGIPLLWLQRLLSIRKWQVEEKRNSFLIFADLKRDMVSIKYAYAGQPKRFNFSQIPKSAQGNPPPVADGIMAGVDMLDIRELMRNQLEPTNYAITMMQYDWVSNTVQINLVDSTVNTPEIPAIPEAVSRQIFKNYKTAAQHIKDSAVFSPSLKPPAIMQSGIVAVIPEKVTKKEYRWMIHGSIRVPVAPGAMVARSGTFGDSTETPFAIVTAIVVINTLDNKEPSWVTLKLPVLTPCKAGDLVDVSFSVDLKQFNSQFSDPGVYQVFIACGAFVAGTFALEVVE